MFGAEAGVLEGAGVEGGFHPAKCGEWGWLLWSALDFSLRLRGTLTDIDGFALENASWLSSPAVAVNCSFLPDWM